MGTDIDKGVSEGIRVELLTISETPAVDLTDYLVWREEYVGGANRLAIPYQALTRENIEALGR